MRTPKHLTFDKIAGEIFIGTIICEMALVAIYWFDVLNGNRFQVLHALFDLDGEGNIPAWFSSVQLMMVALSFWTHALRQPLGLRPSKRFFALAGCAALYVSMDEAGQVHEQVTGWMGRRYVDWLPGYAGRHFWMVMVMVAIVVGVFQFLAVDLVAIWREQRHFALLALLGIGVGLAGGMGFETLGYKLLNGDRTILWYKVEVTLEEFLEMFGATLILFATLKLNRVLAPKRLRAICRAGHADRSPVPSLVGAAPH